MALQSNGFDPSDLLRRYLEGTCTSEEKALIEDWYETLQDGSSLPGEALIEEDLAAVFERLRQGRMAKRKRAGWPGIAAALALLLSAGLGIYFWNAGRDKGQPELGSRYEADVPPGGNKATLTFSSGKSITLSEDKEGIVTGNEVRYDDGTLLPDALSGQAGVRGEVSYLTLTTPRGGQYRVTLPDGSKVWLNAASSLTYPASFTGEQRMVSLSGEGFFEVTKNAEMPFVVESQGQQIRVLGTSFNVNGYENPVTTLLSGLVQVSRPGQGSVSLKAGQQSVWTEKGFSVRSIDTAEAVAWKNGFIAGSAVSLPEIVRQIERWYDVDFQMPAGQQNTEKAYISINRNENLSSVLDALELTYGVRFTIEGKEVIAQE